MLGHVTDNIELKSTPSGTSVCNFTVATNRRVKKDDQWEDSATFHRITAWAKVAEIAAKNLGKGTKVYISARLDYRSYEDKDGKKVYVTDIIAEDIIPMEKKEGGSTAKKKPAKKEEGEAQETEENNEDVNTDDIPF